MRYENLPPFYMALFGLDGAEISGHGYARQRIKPAPMSDDQGIYRIDNADTVTFPPVTDGSYMVVALALYDALTGGRAWTDAHPTTSGEVVPEGQRFQIPVAAAAMTLRIPL